MQSKQNTKSKIETRNFTLNRELPEFQLMERILDLRLHYSDALIQGIIISGDFNPELNIATDFDLTLDGPLWLTERSSNSEVLRVHLNNLIHTFDKEMFLRACKAQGFKV